MMAVDYAIFPAVEKLAVNILKAARDTDNIFSPLTPHIGTKIPSSPDWSNGVVTVGRVGGVPTERHWLDHPNVQFDVWADEKADAHDIAQRVRVSLLRAEGTKYTNPVCFVTGTEDGIGISWAFDTFNLKPRYTGSVYLTLHP